MSDQPQIIVTRPESEGVEQAKELLEQGNPSAADLTPEEEAFYKQRCEELCKAHNTINVHCYVSAQRGADGNRVVGYFKEPSFETKLIILDKANQFTPLLAAHELMQSTLIREASSVEITSELPTFDPFRIGAVMFCLYIIKVHNNVLKKN